MSRNHLLLERRLLEQKNKYRGLVSRFRSKAFVKDRNTSPTMQFRSGLRGLFLDSRAVLHTSAFESFNEWVVSQNEKQLPDVLRSPIGFEELSGVIDAATVSLDVELLWVCERLRVHSETINRFRSNVETIEHFSFAGEFELAIMALQALELDVGSSLWLVQLRIALEQQAGGLERQKKYTADVRGVYKRGLLAFIAFNTSVRNEERTTLAKYRDDVRERIERHRYYSDSVKTYMRYRLASEMATTENELAEILRIEQSHSVIDIYETFVAIAQEVVKQEHFRPLRKQLLKSLMRLDGIKDFRINKLVLQLGGQQPVHVLPRRNRNISDLLFEGRIAAARRTYRHRSRVATVVDPWCLIYSGLVSAYRADSISVIANSEMFIELIGGVLSRRYDFNESYSKLLKLVSNFRGFSAAAGLLDMLLELKRSSPDAPWRPWFISLNSPTLGIEDQVVEKGSEEKNGLPLGFVPCGATEAAWMYMHRPDTACSQSRNIGIAVMTSAGLIARGRYSSAIELLTSFEKSRLPRALGSLYPLLLLHAFHAIGDKQSVVTLIATEGSHNDRYAEVLPIAGCLGLLQWDDFSLVESPLASPIALHQLWVAEENDKTASLLRYATGYALRKLNISRPSELIDSTNNFTNNELIYFMREVCTPSVLDVARILKGSTAVMEERQAIFASLRILDPENSGVYQDEIVNISNQRALDEGQWLVDHTRVHVDKEAFSRWASKELSEDFARYRDLLTIDVGQEGSFDDILKEIGNAGLSKNESTLAQGEADTVLYALLHRAADEFVNNPVFGLDFYLSKRIRHQSFIGLIRGPLEFSQLITTRKSESSDYHSNFFWIDKFNDSGEPAKNSLDEAFKKFAGKFDDILITAKESRFHVRSIEKPEGLLYLELPPHILAIARTISRHDMIIADFAVTLVALFWASLEASLSNTRRFITDELTTQVAEAFDELRASARRSVEPDQAFLELDMAIGQCSTEVQRKLDEAAVWFARTDIKAHMRMFTLAQIVQVAIDSALRCQRAFEPDIKSAVQNGEQQMMASTLIFVHDVLFVALDNARAHSGLKSPKINIQVEPNLDVGTLTVRVQSESKSQSRQAREGKLSETRRLIKLGQIGPRTRKEGESGFFKLAAVVRQSEKGRIDFGFTEQGDFFLEVVYAMSIHKVSPELELV